MSEPDLEGMPSEARCADLRKKWKLTDEPDVRRANITARVLENQSRHFQRLAEETRAVSLGPWISEVFPALKSNLMTHILPDLCAIQPMAGPIGVVHHYQPHRLPDEEATQTDANGVETKVMVPVMQLNVVPTPIQAHSRMCKAHRETKDQTVDDTTSYLLTEIAREVLGTILNSVTESNTDVVKKGADLKKSLKRSAHIVHRTSMRGPANRVIGSAEMLSKAGIAVPDLDKKDEEIHDLGLIDDQRVYLDPLFPKGKLMSWYQGESDQDTGIIYSPYILTEITPNFVDPSDMTLRRAVRTRHKITLVRPEFAHLISVED